TSPRARTNAFARVALLLAKVGNADEATALSREAAVKLGVDPTQLWIESQRLSSALGRPTSAASPRVAGTSRVTTPDRDRVALLVHSMEARRELLPVIDEADMSDDILRTLVSHLKREPETDGVARMAELTDEARDVLAALLMAERKVDDVAALIGQFRAHLTRVQSLKKMREIWHHISETQEKGGVDSPVTEAYRSLHERGGVVYEFSGGVAQTLDHGAPRPSEGAQTNE